MSWKSLDRVYLQESAGKSVGKLPRQQIVNEDLYNVKYKKDSDQTYTDIEVDSEHSSQLDQKYNEII